MASKSKKVTPTAAEQPKLDKTNTLKAIQMEDLGPHRNDRISTTSYGKKTAFVEGATLRLKKIEHLANGGFLTYEQVEKVELWRSAAAAGTVLGNRSPSKAAVPEHEPISQRADAHRVAVAAKSSLPEEEQWEEIGLDEAIAEDFVLV